MSDSTSSPRTALIIASAAVAISTIVLVGGAVMAITMSDHIGFMHGGSRASEQTPLVTDDESVTIAIRDFTYSPANLTVDAGTDVTWTNEDSAVHDATDRADRWHTELLSKGDSETITFDVAGAFEYYCTVHPWMEGVITVRKPTD